MRTYPRDYQFQPDVVPNVIKILIFVTATVSLFSAFLIPMIAFGPQEYFTLSRFGITHYYFWQLISYLFIVPNYGGINLSFIITLLFNLYIIWSIGSFLIGTISSKTFLILYLGSGFFAAVSGTLLMVLIGTNGFVAGSFPSIFALLILWSMLFPEIELLFFFLFPMKAKWLIAGLLGLTILMSISQGDLVNLVVTLAGAAFGYFYGLIALELNGPFQFSHLFEDWLKRKKEITTPTKIFDFKTGKPIEKHSTEDDFMDLMLDKISKHGESSLTARERERMNKISKNKPRK